METYTSSALEAQEAAKVAELESETTLEIPRPPVAPKGELILVVGPLEQEIRVYALILSNASPVFASMLEHARFGEGVALQDATASEPVRISLPEDDPAAMDTICRIIHGKTLDSESPRIIDAPASEILAVAIAADKYDCAPALALAVEHWLKPEKMEELAKWGHVCPKRRDLLMAAYWFKHEKSFEIASRALVAEVAGSFQPLADGREGMDEHIALRIARKSCPRPATRPPLKSPSQC